MVLAQTPSPRPKSAGEIAAVSKLLAEKNKICRRQAREQKLQFLKRCRFIRDCVKALGDGAARDVRIVEGLE
jgi:hypothetical protein